jgi:hypothetical protein
MAQARANVSYIAPWIHMLANIVPKYLRSTNAWPTQQAIIPLVTLERARATRRIVKKENDATINVAMGKKPHKIFIKARGDVDEHCEGKNTWDEAVRTLIP